MYQSTINLVMDKLNQTKSFSFLSKPADPNKTELTVGQIIYLKNSLAIIKFNESLLFLRYDGKIILHEGAKIKLNFTDNTNINNHSKTNIQMKLLGEFLKDEININLKLLQISNNNILKISNKIISNTQNFKIINWLNDFISEFENNFNDSMIDKIKKEDLSSSGLFVKKVLEKIINLMYYNSFSFPSPTEIAKKLTNYVKFFFFNDSNIESELFTFKKFLENTFQETRKDSLILHKELNDNQERITFDKDKIDKNINSYLTIKQLVYQEQNSMIFTIIFNLPIFLQIDQNYNRHLHNKNKENIYEFSLILLTKKFGVIDNKINLLDNTIFITFDLEKNKDYFLSKIPQLRQNLSEKQFSVGNIKVL